MQLECRYNMFGVFNDEFRIGPARWKYFDLLFVHDGHITVWLGEDDRIDIKTGQCVLIYPETDFHGYSVVECTRVSVQHFEIVETAGLPKEIKALAGRTGGFEFFPTPPSHQVDRDIERLINIRSAGRMRPADAETMSAVMVLVLLQIFHAGEDITASRDGEFEELLSFMERNIDRNVSLEEMAQVYGLSASHFRAVFRKRFFQSPGNFFRKLRMDAVAKMLRETATPVKEIARKSGFDMLPNFYRAFRAVYGISPVEYRRKSLPKG